MVQLFTKSYTCSRLHYVPATKSRQIITNISRHCLAKDMVDRWKCVFSLSGLCFCFLSANFLGIFNYSLVQETEIYMDSIGDLYLQSDFLCRTASFSWRNGLSKIKCICMKFHVWNFEPNVKTVVLYTKMYLPLCEYLNIFYLYLLNRRFSL